MGLSREILGLILLTQLRTFVCFASFVVNLPGASAVRLAVFCLSVFSICFQVPANAENWPQFRGPGGGGHTAAKNLPTEWSDTKNVTWKRDIPGEGWSSPVVWEDRIFLTAAVPSEDVEKEYSLRTLCLAGETGEILWNREVFRQTPEETQRIHNKNSHASPTPVTDGKHLWVHFGAQGTACLTLEGATVWKNSEIDYPMNHGNGGSPVLVEGLLFFSCDGSRDPFVVALDQETGKIRWKKPRPPVTSSKTFSFSTPLVIELDGEKQIVSPATDQVVAYRPKDGEVLWTVGYDGYSVIPRPVFGRGLLFLSTSYTNAVAMAISPKGQGDLTETNVVWTNRRGAPHTPSMLVVGSEVYMVSDSGIATCLDAKTGRVHWKERLGGNFSASPLYGDGKIYFQSEEGTGIVIEAGPDYQELARNPMNARTLASYGVIDSDFLIRTASVLYRVGR